jgi:hypothetical protein
MATKGIILGVCIATFVTSLTFTIASLFGSVKENLITGSAIGSGQLAIYSIVPLIISFIVGIFILLTITKK